MDPSNLPDLIGNSTYRIECKTTYWKWEIEWKDKSNLFIFQILVNHCVTSNHEYLMIVPTYGIKNKIKREFSDINGGNEILIDRTYLTLCECLGRGNFGSVYKGILNISGNKSEDVAVKRLENCKFLNLSKSIKYYNQ